MEITLTRENFDAEVMKSNVPVMVDFWASWCGPCKMLAPTVEQLAKEYDGKVKVCKLNVDDCGDIAAMFAIVSIPTVIFFKDGKQVNKLVGVHDMDAYMDALDALV